MDVKTMLRYFMKKNLYLLLVILVVLMSLMLMTCITPPKGFAPKIKAKTSSARFDDKDPNEIVENSVQLDTISVHTVNPVATSPIPDETERSGSGVSVWQTQTTRSVSVKTQNSSLDLGEVVYKIPDTMRIYSTYQATVRISQKNGTTEIIENLDGKVSRASIPITSKMEVELVDASGDSSFTITRINTGRQIVDSNGYTQWIFAVRPIKNGEKRLSLVISVITGDDVKQKVYSDTIHVKNDVVKKVDNFWRKYWQWFATTIIIPLIVWLWNRKKKKDP